MPFGYQILPEELLSKFFTSIANKCCFKSIMMGQMFQFNTNIKTRRKWIKEIWKFWLKKQKKPKITFWPEF